MVCGAEVKSGLGFRPQQEASGGHRGGGSNGRICVDCKRGAAAFWRHCDGLVTEAQSPVEEELQSSRREVISAWTSVFVASIVRKDPTVHLLIRCVRVGRRIDQVCQGGQTY